jgi:hypothetical protein
MATEEDKDLGEGGTNQRPALDIWRWRMGIALLSFSAAWLVSGTVLMWLLVWKPLALGHAVLWSWALIAGSERMRRFYFRAIIAKEQTVYLESCTDSDEIRDLRAQLRAAQPR